MENKKTGASACLNKPRYGEGHIFIWCENYCRRILYIDILYVEASRSYCEFHLIDGSRVTLSWRMRIVEQILPTDTFIRVHHGSRLGGFIVPACWMYCIFRKFLG